MDIVEKAKKNAVPLTVIGVFGLTAYMLHRRPRQYYGWGYRRKKRRREKKFWRKLIPW